MPVLKFRSIEEMNRHDERASARQVEPWRAMVSLWTLGARMQQRRFRPGVRKFRSVEEMKGDHD